MSRLTQLPAWLLTSGILLILAAFFRFAVLGYDYIGHTLAFAAVLVILHRFLGKGLWRAVCVLVCVGLIYFIIVEIPIIKNSRTDRDCGRKYAVVLGAGVVGDTPSRQLSRRINAAVSYLEAYPDSVAIVSGGQGKGENISEAQCMFDRITARGIAPERVIMEDRATSTKENLEFSFDIIRSLGDEPDGNTAIISASYHLYRAKTMARLLGVESAGYAAYPGWFLIALNYYIREAFGVTWLWAFGI